MLSEGALVYQWFYESEGESESCSVVSDSLQPQGLYSPWNSPGQNPGVGSLSLSRGSPNPGIEPRSPVLHSYSLPAEPQGKSKNAGWVAYPFSRGSSQTRNQTGVSCIAGGFFTSWATREAPSCFYPLLKTVCLAPQYWILLHW